MMNIFVSYSSHDRAQVTALVADLTSLGHHVWYDQELTGGQHWWDRILSEIRACSLFISAVTEMSVQSGPSQREYTYAHALGKPLLPVLLSTEVNIALLPLILQERQFVNYANADKAALLALNRAIEAIEPAPPLPDPLPPPPDIPVSPLWALQSLLDQPVLSEEEQLKAFYQLRQHAANPALADDANALLERLEKHPSLLAALFRDVAAFRAQSGTAHLRLRRRKAYSSALVPFSISLDGAKVASIRNGEEKVIELTPGRHTLQVSLQGFSSKPFEFDATPGETLAFECGPGTLFGVTLQPLP